ncbi:MAG: AAA family ATPase [Candidatus Saccharimonadales bacterium]
MAAIGFYRDSEKYYVFLDRRIIYKGSDPPMMHLTIQAPVFFRSFEHLVDFLRELPGGEPPAPQSPPQPTSKPNRPKSTPPPEDYDISKVANISEIKTPAKTVNASPDRKTIQRELEKVIVGQERAVETVAQQTALFVAKENAKKPLSMLFYGPSGVGKSEMATAISKILTRLCGREYGCTWVDLNQYTESHSNQNLVGCPPGYIGHGEKPIFGAVEDNKYQIFVFDELDKAHPEILRTFMSVLDSGIATAATTLKDGSRHYNFKNSILIFTSNYQLGASPKKRIGFSIADDVTDIKSTDSAVEISYNEAAPTNEQTTLTQRIYQDSESARKKFVELGTLKEIAARFQCYVGFDELTEDSKIKILVKQILETSSEYGVKLTKISTPIIQGIVDAALGGNSLTVRSNKSVVEGILASAFVDAAKKYRGKNVKLEGTIEKPIIKP